ncbi:hypothetical protein NIES2100_79960 (plasmid) [Calothrix sp. NIES-2100]|uniref:hypothetical protein n=1 Tax=Calothrix sp. NIES-2100 TaxID=1954172 RepID=UPI000B6047AB|nr:hypothetical protein NIES2100_79960 [Calothrix sp. NIES-2100]
MRIFDITNYRKLMFLLGLALGLKFGVEEGLGYGHLLTQGQRLLVLVLILGLGLVLVLVIGLGLGLGLKEKHWPMPRRGLWLWRGLILGGVLGITIGLGLALGLMLGLVLGLMLALGLTLGLGLLERWEISKGYMPWLRKVLPQDWWGELEALRHKWRKQGQSKLWIRVMTHIHLLDMLKGYVQIKIENAKFFKIVFRRKN